MKSGWLIGLLVLFLLLSIVNGVCEMTFATGNPETIFNGVINNVQVLFSEDANIGSKIWEGITLPFEVLWLIFRAFWFDYSFLTGDWIFLRFLFMSVSVGIIISIIFAIRGTSST